MNKLSMVAIVIVLFLSSATFAFAEESQSDLDIVPTTRTEDEIAAQVALLENLVIELQKRLEEETVGTRNVFLVKVDDTVVFSHNRTNYRWVDAKKECEKVAYNPQNMWKVVSCTYGLEVMYKDVFVAG